MKAKFIPLDNDISGLVHYDFPENEIVAKVIVNSDTFWEMCRALNFESEVVKITISPGDTNSFQLRSEGIRGVAMINCDKNSPLFHKFECSDIEVSLLTL